MDQIKLSQFRQHVCESEEAPQHEIRHLSPNGMASSMLALERRVFILERFIEASGLKIDVPPTA